MCQKATSSEAAKVVRGKGSAKCDLSYLFYNVYRLGNCSSKRNSLPAGN